MERGRGVFSREMFWTPIWKFSPWKELLFCGGICFFLKEEILGGKFKRYFLGKRLSEKYVLGGKIFEKNVLGGYFGDISDGFKISTKTLIHKNPNKQPIIFIVPTIIPILIHSFTTLDSALVYLPTASTSTKKRNIHSHTPPYHHSHPYHHFFHLISVHLGFFGGGKNVFWRRNKC